MHEPVRRYAAIAGVASRADPLCCVVLPGAHIDADRYAWLGAGVAAAGFETFIIDPPIVYRTTPFSPTEPVKTKLVTREQLAGVLTDLEKKAGSVCLIGHSWGGAVILDHVAALGASVGSLAGCAILGTSLQATALGLVIPGRSDTDPLKKPPGLPVLFIAGEHDLMAPPAAMRKTSQRYDNETCLIVQSGGNHLNWASGRGWADRPDLDGLATVAAEQQQAATLSYIVAFCRSIHTRVAGRFNALREIVGAGDTIEWQSQAT